MEGIGTQVFRSIQSFWRHRGYRRLEGTKKQAKAIRLGGGGTNSRRLHRKARVVWPTLRLRLRAWPAPLRLMARMKNAYVETMLSLAGGEGRPSALNRVRSGSDALWGRRMPRARQMSSRSGDFERRMMQHIYNSIAEPELPYRAR
ncbi:unnamed protein product [Musa acuminata subsp. malaccensis]|uniref:(wild Malaysian banana) hypothetical protein n=1 Tax=Musa acuminata subsp. malaccensis TaxID=214687 RepID=A0A8D7A2B7_MUSAM|nr:PREDICTED: uncharacterized protein LOC108952607 [Musa acuminata subsp. malaccensis]CAG1841385.1 unnamed protein product [Musa acuminata subsp. malaccensis]